MANSTSAREVALSRNPQCYRRLSPDEFVEKAKQLVDLGWHPIPLTGIGGKVCGAKGVTGREGVDVADDDIFRQWANTWAGTPDGLNLGTRMPVGVISLDVDCYHGKPGADTIAACTAEWGELPPTWSITARNDGSRKLLFRVPAGWEGVGVIAASDGGMASGVEVLQRHHRYAVVPPSIHDVGHVRTFGPDGEVCEQFPMPGDLPMLPELWVEGLRKNHTPVQRHRTAEPDYLLASFPDGLMTDAVQTAMRQVLDSINSGAGRHDTMNQKVLELLWLGWGGATGVPLAVEVVRAAFIQALAGERGEEAARTEFDRSLKGAAEIVAAAGPSFAHAFQPGGIWHKDSDWIIDADTGLVMRGIRNSAGDEPVGFRFATVSARALAQPVPPMEWLVRGVWPRNSFGPMGGEKKTLKSYNLLSMSVAVSSGEPLFGEFEVLSPKPVVYYVGEGGQAPFQRRLQAIACAYKVDLADLPLHAVFEVGALDSPVFTDALKRNLDEIQPGLVIVDPLYAFHPSGVEAQNLYERGRMLAGLSSLVADETALIIADHFRKTGSADLDLDSIAQSGMGQWADSWILQKHREKANLGTGSYQLAVEFGSRQWGGSRWELDWQLPAFGQLEEGQQEEGGATEVGWEIRRSDGGESGRATRRRNSVDVGKKNEILEVIRANPFLFTKNQLFAEVGGNKAAVEKELKSLEVERRVEVKHAAAPDANGRMTTRDRYGIGPGITFSPIIRGS
ncbi:AAA family ATPase [Rhodococcus sp. ARP2]|uniref:AAA family ATPase n=1 Tax=Rhodococcus sp. ARP2 TaxID=1661385 RepID=UPI0009E3D802